MRSYFVQLPISCDNIYAKGQRAARIGVLFFLPDKPPLICFYRLSSSKLLALANLNINVVYRRLL